MRAETRGKQRKCKQCTSDDHWPPVPGFALAADREARRDLKAGAGQPAPFFRRLRKDAQRRCALHIRYFQSTLLIGGMFCAIHAGAASAWGDRQATYVITGGGTASVGGLHR